MERFKGIIALDIDGTITTERDRVDPTVVHFFNELIADRWALIFISGRTFSFARPLLSGLQGNYFFSVQNGAALYEMPAVKELKRAYLGKEAIAFLAPFFEKERLGLLIESGLEREDICYYKPKDYSDEDLDYIKLRIEISPEPWIAVQSFDEVEMDHFPVGKFFATAERAHAMAALLSHKFNVIVIRDPFRSGGYLAHINSKEASKGHILEKFVAMHERRLPLIAAGDDHNDVAMLLKSDVKIVMGNAPQELHRYADVLAPPASELGIISALKGVISERFS